MKNIKFWNRLAKSYDKKILKKYNITYKKMVDITSQFVDKEDNVLDFACGTGLTTVKLAHNVKKIHAIDLSEKMILIAKDRSEKENVKNIEFSVLDIYSNSIKQTYDVIIAFNILHFIDDTNKVLLRINELLNTDGYFISVTDCLKDLTTFEGILQSLISRIGIIPKYKKFKSYELKNIIVEKNFRVVYDEIIHDNPVNYCLVTQKLN